MCYIYTIFYSQKLVNIKPIAFFYDIVGIIFSRPEQSVIN